MPDCLQCDQNAYLDIRLSQQYTKELLERWIAKHPNQINIGPISFLSKIELLAASRRDLFYAGVNATESRLVVLSHVDQYGAAAMDVVTGRDAPGCRMTG